MPHFTHHRLRESSRVSAAVQAPPVARVDRRQRPLTNRAAGGESRRSGSVTPPERWYEPHMQSRMRIITQKPGEGYRHVVTAAEVRERLARLPAKFTRSLEIVQLSGMTRKKLTYPCYGMQWGSAIYLYPIEESLTETFHRPPRPAELIEARQFGGRWIQVSRDRWQLRWDESSLRDFYLNNILIHELGHLVDQRNSSSVDRERYAEWFALEYGYKPTR
ncbi:MAG: hypothetical protein ACKOUR_13990 [Planctomycetota bacterium]